MSGSYRFGLAAPAAARRRRRLCAPDRASPDPGRLAFSASGRDELVPLADHVVVLVHHRVPAGDAAHAVVVGAAVTDRAGLLQERAVGRLDVVLGGLAL